MKQLFFVTPIGDDGSASRKRSNQILRHILEPAFNEKYEIIRADLIDLPGSIHRDIIRYLYDSDLVISDVTGLNPNVMYELGIRHAFNKPVIYVAQEKQQLPFDLGAERTIFFDISDIDSVAKARNRIIAAEKAIWDLEDNYQSPVFSVLNQQAIFAKNANIGAALEELVNKVENVSDEVADLQFDMSFCTDNDVGLSREEANMLSEIHSVVSSIRPWELELILSKLRKQT
ncbi:hypothetical protein [Celeribacter sp.]|uniref:hypothetical protein n=1 Tax=Celeribacter sp. TaxID=1890673 RepID=UPI003A92C830